MAKGVKNDFSIILSELREDTVRDLYILEGKEDYLKEKLVNSLTKILIAPGARDLDRVVIDFDGKFNENLMESIFDNLATPAFLSKRKLIIAKRTGLFSDYNEKDLPAYIERICAGVNKYSTLVFIEDKFDKRKKSIANEIEKKGIIANITKAEFADLLQWTRNYFAMENIKVNKSTAGNFVEKNDFNLLLMENEAEKLKLYLNYNGRNELTDEHLEIVGRSDLKGNIFTLMDLIGRGNAKEALLLLDELIERKEPVQLILFMFARHIKQLIGIKCYGNTSNEGFVAEELKIPGFMVNKLKYQCRDISLRDLEDMYLKCNDADISIKTSAVDGRHLLEMLIVTFAEIHSDFCGNP